MPRNTSTVAKPPPARHVTPSGAAWKAGHRNITISPTVPVYETLDARRKTAGKSFEELFVGALLDQDQVRAAAHDEGVAEGKDLAWKAGRSELAALKREHAAKMTALRQEHAAGMAAASQRTQAAIAAAEARGRAAADPELRAEAEQARQEAESWRAGGTILVEYFDRRGKMLLDQTDGSPARAVLGRWLDAQEAVIRATLGRQADQLPLPRQVAAEIEAARADERTVVVGVAGGRIVELERTHAVSLTAATSRIRELEVALAAAQARTRDLEAVMAGVDAEAIAERARRDPSDWLLGLSAAFSRVAAQPRLAALAAAQRPVR